MALSAMAIAAIVAAVAAAGAGTVSATNSAKARHRTKLAEARNKAWYDRRYNEDYTQTAEAQSAINSAKDYAREAYGNSAGAAAVSGATDASVAQDKAKANQMVATVTRDIAAQATSRKEAIDKSYKEADTKYQEQLAKYDEERSQAVADAASQVAQAGANYYAANMESVKNTGTKNMFSNTISTKVTV